MKTNKNNIEDGSKDLTLARVKLAFYQKMPDVEPSSVSFTESKFPYHQIMNLSQ